MFGGIATPPVGRVLRARDAAGSLLECEFEFLFLMLLFQFHLLLFPRLVQSSHFLTSFSSFFWLRLVFIQLTPMQM